MDQYDDEFFPRYQACPSTGPLSDNELLWSGLFQPFIKNQQIYVCPASAPPNRYAEVWSIRGEGTYGANATIGGWYYPSINPPCGGMILGKINNLTSIAKSVMFADSLNGATASGYRGYLSRNDALNFIGLSINDRHLERTNIGFFDGHSKTYLAKALLGNPLAPYECTDTSIFTGMWWLDKNAAGLKWNITDPCVNIQ